MKIKPVQFSPRVASLLANVASFDTGTIALAAKELAAQQAKEAQEKALTVLRTADEILKAHVRNLQNIREQEKKAKAALKKLDSAVVQFIKDGDVEALKKNTGGVYYFGV